ncbi:MAG: quinone oxidoreductase [Armatimonadetes bacterium]|nr:quinone oxidoreductase [Armatimonadota bacterium]
MKGIRVHATGGPEVLRYEDLPEPQPGPGEALVRVEAIGVNFIDVYHRTGLYARPLPFTPGLEGAGTVVRIGSGAADLAPGDRVAWAGVSGSYAGQVVGQAARMVKVPDGLDAPRAAAAMLQGITAHYLVHSTYPLRPGEWALVHAAAGGVGLLLVQMAKRLGASVIGTTSTEAKARLAREAGADHVILYTEQDFEAETRRLTGGRGVAVVYDSVGRTTFEKSLNCLVPRGYMVLFGQASGPVPPVDPQVLNTKGSLFLTRPTSAHYTATRDELLHRTSDVFRWIQSGELKVRIDHQVPLAQAAEAHRMLESRQTTGKVLLMP